VFENPISQIDVDLMIGRIDTILSDISKLEADICWIDADLQKHCGVLLDSQGISSENNANTLKSKG
jgi:hypothetical protein